MRKLSAMGSHGMRRRAFALAAAAVTALGAGAAGAGEARATPMGRPGTAALQVALRALGLYGASIDGLFGPRTRSALVRFQRRAGIVPDGIPGPVTRRALGRRGRPALGRRLMHSGQRGWDVAELQFLLAWHGFPSGTLDGGFGPHTRAAAVRFQRWTGIAADGLVGLATLSRLRAPPRRCMLPLARPVSARLGDGFGPRGARFHTGLDFPAPYGTRVRAAARGRVAWAGYNSGGWGNLVTVADGRGVRTMYAHLSSLAVRRGRRVSIGTAIGRVGATGFATGPHLHFELRLRGAALDPLPCLR